MKAKKLIAVRLLMLMAVFASAQEPLEDVSVSFELQRGALTATAAQPPAAGDGVQVGLRQQSLGAYIVSVWRRDGGVMIEKTTPAGRVGLTPPMSAPAGRKVKAAARNEPDGSVRVWLELDGKVAAAAVDRQPLLGPGTAEILSRNAQYTATNMVVEPAQPDDVVPPAIGGPEAQNVTDMLATIFWTTDEPADGQVEYGETVKYGQSSGLARGPALSHTAPLAGLKPAAVYHFRVKSRDARGNLAVSPDQTFTTGTGPDKEAPYASIQSPVPGAGLTGEVGLSASAFDDTKVAGLQFRLDGVVIGSELLEAPYSMNWDTRSASNGTHVLTAAVRDGSGKTSVSGPVTVVVRNSAQAR